MTRRISQTKSSLSSNSKFKVFGAVRPHGSCFLKPLALVHEYFSSHPRLIFSKILTDFTHKQGSNRQKRTEMWNLLPYKRQKFTAKSAKNAKTPFNP